MISAPSVFASRHQPQAMAPAKTSHTARRTAAILGLGLLGALVAALMAAGGIFGLMQNGIVLWFAGAILFGWTCTGAGALVLAVVYRMPLLPKREPGRGLHA